MELNKRSAHVYAIIRVDLFLGDTVSPERKIAVKKIVMDVAIAEAEVKRLQDLQKDEGVVYFMQVTRLELNDLVLVPSSVTCRSIEVR